MIEIHPVVQSTGSASCLLPLPLTRFARESLSPSGSENIRIVSGKDGLISIEFDEKAPQFAANVANAYVEELRTLIGRLAVTEAQQRRLIFEKQLTKAKENLTAAEQALRATGSPDRAGQKPAGAKPWAAANRSS